MRQDTSSVERIGTLHGLRGAMAVWVVLHHYSAAGLGRFQVPKYGYLGVDVFFVLSGLVLYLVHGHQFRTLSTDRWIAFVKARFWRIYPLFFASFVMSLAVFIWRHGNAPTVDQLYFSALMLEGWAGNGMNVNPPVWSLGAEWFGYLAFPVIAYATLRLNGLAALAAMAGLMVGSVGVATLLPIGWDLTETWYGVLRMGIEFAAGCLLVDIMRRHPSLMARHGDALFLGGCLTLLAVLMQGWLAWAMPCVVVIVSGAAASGPLSRLILANPIAIYLGNASFGLYLFHKPVEAAFLLLVERQPALWFRVLSTLGLIAISLALASLLSAWIERPVLRWYRGQASMVPARASPLLGLAGQ